jgi:triacylglycerol lipase
MGKNLEAAIGALNGLVGDWLVRTDNGLATSMSLHAATRDAAPMRTAKELEAIADGARVVVLVHGLMCSESVWEFPGVEPPAAYGSLLNEDFGLQPLYLRYNTGLPIADNGRALSGLLDALAPRVAEIVFLGYSMGGLVVRSACHDAASRAATWLRLVTRAFYLGTPHGGAPLERFGRRFSALLGKVPDPYFEVGRELVELRSQGVKDLGDPRWAPDLADASHPLPLLPSISHYLVAGSLTDSPTWTRLFGDALVPLESATNGVIPEEGKGRTARIPPTNARFLRGMNHLALAHDRGVYGYLKAWMEEPCRTRE